MKYNILLFIFLFSLTGLAQKKKIRLTFEYIKPYCGGARPTEEMTKDAETPKPYAGKTIIYISGKGRIDSAVTDERGTLNLKLKKGYYLMFERWRFNLYTPNDLPIENFDRQCLKTEWEKAICRVKVKRKSTDINALNPIVQFCSWNSPCLTSTPAIPE
jgi:hypothetical protein